MNQLCNAKAPGILQCLVQLLFQYALAGIFRQEEPAETGKTGWKALLKLAGDQLGM